MANNTQVDVPARPAPHAEDVPSEDREGGLQAWLAVAGSFLVYFSSFGVINSFGFFQSYYQTHYLSSYPPSTIAFIGTLQITLMFLMGPITGALFDTFGLKYLYPTAAVGCAGSLLALSFTQPNEIWQQFLAQGLLFGLTAAFGVQPALAIVGQYFKRRRALAMGIVAGGSSVGGVCLPIMFARLVPTIGFGWALRVAALLILLCYGIAMGISRTNQPLKTLNSATDLLDYGGFLDVRYLGLAVGTFLANLGLYVPYYYIEPFADFLHPTINVAAFLLPLINASSFFGRVIGGHFADVIGRLNLLYPMTVTSGVLCLVMWLLAQHVGLIIAFVCLYGFCSGILISVMPAAVGQITPEDRLGARLGAFSSITAAAVLMGTPVGGALIQGDSRAGYQPLVFFSGITLVAGGLVLFGARLLHDNNLLKKW